MTIRINQIAVDFTLENEKTFADLTTAVRAWALGQNLAILGILADGQARSPDDKAPLETFSEIDIEAVPAGERDLARVAVLARFFALVSHGWDKNDRKLLEELHGEFESIKSALFPLLSPLADRITGPLKDLDGPWNTAETQGKSARIVAAEVEGRRRELQDPRGAASETLSNLEKSLDALADLGMLFQRGDDKAGFERILGLFTLLEDLGRRAELFLRDNPDGAVAWAGFQVDLRPVLKETEAALASGDLILVTDLLEYEVTPRLKQISSLFPGLSNLDRATSVL